MKATTLNNVFTKSIPAVPEAETLYVSMDYQTAVHLCACGCGAKVVTPIGPNDWVLTFDGTVTLCPSVGSGQQPCRSHYYIRHDHIDWRPKISKAATKPALAQDHAVHDRTPEVSTIREPWWRRAWSRFKSSGLD
jgi:hypothetical protein